MRTSIYIYIYTYIYVLCVCGVISSEMLFIVDIVLKHCVILHYIC